MKRALVAILLTVSSTSTFVASSSAQGPGRNAKIAIFVGPQTREGFIDVDSGILDSIEDVQNEFQHASKFRLVRTPGEADILLFVVGRRTTGQSGSVGVPIAGMALFLPIKGRAIDTLLRVGSYERAITSQAEESERWKSSAKSVVKSVTAWVEANRQALPHK